MPGRGGHRPGPSDHLLRNAAEVALAVARRRLSDDPPVPAPRRLVPFLGFAHLPERALGPLRRVLDEDEGLRHATRDATDEASVGRAAWLFLDRPEGWEGELDRLIGVADEMAAGVRDQREESDARRRLQAEEQARRRAEEEVTELVRQLGEVKESLAAERRARRRAESDAGRLRRRVADLASEVDERRRSQSELRLALDQARTGGGGDGGRGTGGGLGAPVATDEDGERRREERREDELLIHRDLTSAVVDAREAVEVLSGALAEAARLLVSPAQATTATPALARPRGGSQSKGDAGLGRRAVPLPPGTFDDSVAAAEHLVRVGRVLVLVDGYNVTKLARPDLSLVEQRGWVVDAAVELAARTGAQVELIFDGADERGSAPADLGRRMGVQIRYSSEGIEADDVILDLVANAPVARPVVVASDDRRVQDGARRLGANVITSPQLLAVLRRPM